MSGFALLLVAGLAGGCGTTGPAPAPDPAPRGEAPETTDVEATVEADPEPAAPSLPAWRWEGERPSRQDALPASATAPDGIRCEADEPHDRRFRVRCFRGDELLWERTQYATSPGAALAFYEDQLMLVRWHRQSPGAWLSVYVAETGTERWRLPLQGLGDIANSEYLTGVQLEAGSENITVYGWESAGRYIERVSLDGATAGNWRRLEEPGASWVASTVPEPSLHESSAPPASPPPLGVAAELTFDWPGAPRGERATTFEAEVARPGGGSCQVQSEGARTSFGCVDGTGRALFSEDLPGSAMMRGRAIVAAGRLLVVARFHPIASGCEMAAYDMSNGVEQWRRHLYGVGPVDHSRYQNEVALEADGETVRVYGWETAGRYLTVLDPATGRAIGHQAFDASP